MSLRYLFVGLALVAGLLTSTGCCHKHHKCCGTSCCSSCYSSPASRTEAPTTMPIMTVVQPQR
jgi:hypothetical protein